MLPVMPTGLLEDLRPPSPVELATIPNGPPSRKAFLLLAVSIGMMLVIATIAAVVIGNLIVGVQGEDVRVTVGETGLVVPYAPAASWEDNKPTYNTCLISGGDVVFSKLAWGTEAVWDGPTIPSVNGCSHGMELKMNSDLTLLLDRAG